MASVAILWSSICYTIKGHTKYFLSPSLYILFLNFQRALLKGLSITLFKIAFFNLWRHTKFYERAWKGLKFLWPYYGLVYVTLFSSLIFKGHYNRAFLSPSLRFSSLIYVDILSSMKGLGRTLMIHSLIFSSLIFVLLSGWLH